MDTASGNNKICERSNPEMCVIADSIAPAATTESAQPNFARGLIFAPAATCGRLLSLLSTHLFLAHL